MSLLVHLLYICEIALSTVGLLTLSYYYLLPVCFNVLVQNGSALNQVRVKSQTLRYRVGWEWQTSNYLDKFWEIPVLPLRSSKY